MRVGEGGTKALGLCGDPAEGQRDLRTQMYRNGGAVGVQKGPKQGPQDVAQVRGGGVQLPLHPCFPLDTHGPGPGFLEKYWPEVRREEGVGLMVNPSWAGHLQMLHGAPALRTSAGGGVQGVCCDLDATALCVCLVP